MIVLDGSSGEGGGQLLRTALSLSMITGQPFRIEKIRAGRKTPGLLRQHLACVAAARTICGAKLAGAELLSQKLAFEPGAVKAGHYDFAVGSAGSTCLVFQTLLPALMLAGRSTLRLSGVTHNAFAPSYDDLAVSFLPLLRRMGAIVETRLDRHGFYPAAGGRWQAEIGAAPTLAPLALEDTGAALSRKILARVANVPFEVAERETAAAADLLGWPKESIEAHTVKADGPGNLLSIRIACQNVTETFTTYGERGFSSEAVAAEAVEKVRDYLAVGAPVGPHLADQALLPLALAGSGYFVTGRLTPHARTTIEVIEKFLPVEFDTTELETKRYRIAVST